nr:integrase, catalytic region, zinc finger, CCHC-type, peptidase aspartic, catalytic [Tanacetum cinerariifolium]
MAELQFRMFKDDSLSVMGLIQEKVKLQEHGLSTLLEMCMQINLGLEEMDSDYEDLQLHTTSYFKADHVDAFDSDCEDEATASAIFMASIYPVESINGDTVGPTYDSEILSEIVEIVLWHLDFGYSKHMTSQLDKLINLVSKFIGTIRFGNDHFTAIMGYGDLQMGNIMISRVYYIKGLGHNLFTIWQFYDLDLEVAFRKYTCFVLVPNQAALTSAKPPSKNDLDLLFQPMFDEYFKHSPSAASMTVFTTTLPPPDTAKAFSSTTIDQDAPSPSTTRQQKQ